MQPINISIFILFGLTVLVSCTPNMDGTEIESMTLEYDKGIFAGIDIGDSWEDVKSTCHRSWEIQEEEIYKGVPNYVLRKDWDEGYNFMYLNCKLDEQKKVIGLSFELHGTEKNALKAREFMHKVYAFYSDILTPNSNTSWEYFPENGMKYNVSFFNTNPENLDTPEETILLEVKPAEFQ